MSFYNETHSKLNWLTLCTSKENDKFLRDICLLSEESRAASRGDENLDVFDKLLEAEKKSIQSNISTKTFDSMHVTRVSIKKQPVIEVGEIEVLEKATDSLQIAALPNADISSPKPSYPSSTSSTSIAKQPPRKGKTKTTPASANIGSSGCGWKKGFLSPSSSIGEKPRLKEINKGFTHVGEQESFVQKPSSSRSVHNNTDIKKNDRAVSFEDVELDRSISECDSDTVRETISTSVLPFSSKVVERAPTEQLFVPPASVQSQTFAKGTVLNSKTSNAHTSIFAQRIAAGKR